MTKAEQPTITQADRDLAASFVHEATCFDCKDELELAFACHRIAAENRTTSLAAQDGLVEALEAMREPTDEMLTAALETSTRFGKPAMKRIWQNMIDAKVSAIKGDKS